MSATTQATPEGTSPVAAIPPAATPAPLTAADAVKALDTVDLATLQSVLTKAPAPGEAKPVEPAPVAATPAPAAEPAAAPAEPAASEPAGDEPQPEKLGKFRLSARDFKEAEFMRLAKTLPISEAYAKVYGTTAPAAPATAAAPSAEPAPAATPAPAAPVENAAITQAKTALAKLESDLGKAQEDADLAAVTKIMREIGKTERTLERLESDAVSAQKAAESQKLSAAEQAFLQKESAVFTEVASAFPKLGDPASQERAEFQQFIDLKRDDPDYESIFGSPLRLRVLAREFAEAKGWGKATAPAATVAQNAPRPGAPAAPRVTAAEVLTPGATQGGSRNIDARSALAAVEGLSFDQLKGVLNGVKH